MQWYATLGMQNPIQGIADRIFAADPIQFLFSQYPSTWAKKAITLSNTTNQEVKMASSITNPLATKLEVATYPMIHLAKDPLATKLEVATYPMIHLAEKKSCCQSRPRGRHPSKV